MRHLSLMLSIIVMAIIWVECLKIGQLFSVVIASVIRLSAVMLSAVVLSVIILKIVMLMVAIESS
jgi:hypothetical protein